MAKEPSSKTLTRAPERARPGGGPSKLTREVLSGARRGDPTPPGLDRSGKPALERGGPGDRALPLAADSFLGREAELALIEALFERSRLVTITGAPGMGKTRLATEIARSAPKDRYPHGRWLVPLAPVAGFELVAPALAAAMGAPDQGEADIVDGLVRHIGDKRLLIVLDNCEHVLDASARLAGAVLASCPEVRILATSQERLGVPGEQVSVLRGLEVPARDTEAEPSVEALASSPAVRLFAERAQSAHPDFQLTAEVVGAVAEICRRLDGIPLAIELAAGRMGTLSPAEVAGLLEDRFALLTGGARTVLPRHQTLKAAVDWAYDLLTDEEQAVLRRLSVFAGGATLDAVEQVCAGEPVGADACLDILTRLAARSLVVADTGSAGHAFGGVHGGAKPPRVSRYGLLETIRFYGRDRLVETGEASTTAARHLAWALQLAETAEPQLTGANQRPTADRLAAEHDNLRAAMAHGLDQGPTEQALRLAGALAMFWRLEGHFREGHHWLNRALAVSEEAPAPARAKALWARSLMAAMVGKQTTAAESAQAALTLFENSGDYVGVARSLLVLGSVSLPGRSVATEVTLLQRCLALARRENDAWCLAQALASCGASLVLLGDPGTARPMLEESIALGHSAGDEQSVLVATISLGNAAMAQGDLGGAEEALSEALATTGRGHFPYERAMIHIALAMAASGRGDHQEAHRLVDAAATDGKGSGAWRVSLDLTRAWVAWAEGDVESAGRFFDAANALITGGGASSAPLLRGLGSVALARGQTTPAKPLLEESLRLATADGSRSEVARTLSVLADLAAATNDPVRASSLHRQALALWHEIGNRAGLADSLESVAGIEARAGRAARAIRAFAVARTLRDANGYARNVLRRDGYEADLALARAALGAEAFDVAWAEATVAPIASVVSALSRGRRKRDTLPASGVAALTATEREVARLALAGNSNGEIAAKLFVTISTVKSHVASVYKKLSVSTRSELRSRYSPEGL